MPHITRRIFRLHGLLLAAALACAAPAHADPARASRYYEDALSRYNRQDYNGTIIQLKNALQQDRNMLAAHLLLGRTLLAMGEMPTAEVALATAQSMGVSRTEIAPLLAQALYGQGKFQQLVERVTPAGLTPAGQLDVLILRGAAYSEMGDNQNAVRSFDEARAIDPDAIQLLLADSAFQLKQRKTDAAMALADRAVAVAPGNADAWTAKAGVHAVLRQTQAALTAYGKAVTAQPRHIEARVARATLLLDLGQDAAAQQDVDELARFASGEPRAAFLRATLAGRRGDNATVHKALGEVVAAIDPLSAEARARKPELLMLGGTAHYGLGSMQKAREYLEALLRLQPLNVGATKLLAAVYLSANDPTHALALLDGVRHQLRSDPAGLTMMANAHLAQRRYQKAAELYQQAAQLGAAQSPDLMMNLGLSLVGLGQSAEALQQLKAAFAGRPGDIRSGMALATLHLRRNDAKAAVAVMDQVVAANDKNPLAHNLLGMARGAAGDRPGARAAYERSAALEARLAAPRLNLAKLDAADGKPEAARARLLALLKTDRRNGDAMFELALLDEQAGKPADALRWLEKARAEDERNVRVILYLAELHLRQSRPAQALEAAKAAAAAQPEALNVLAVLARTQIAAQDATAARATLSTMTRLAEFDPDAQVEVARLQQAAGNLPGANYSIEKALAARADHFGALAMQAEVALRNNELAKAEQLGKTLVAKYPDRAVGHHVLGDVAGGRGQYAQALSSHRTALAREPGTDSALRVFRAHLASGEAARGVAFLQEWQRGNRQPDVRLDIAIAEGYMRAADWKGARAALEKIMRERGEGPMLQNNLAVVLTRLGDPGALAMAEKAWKSAPDSAAVIDTYGWALAKAGRLDQALGLLRDARLRAPASAEIRYHLAWTLAAAGRKVEARDELTAVLKDPAGFDGIEDARRLMAELGR